MSAPQPLQCHRCHAELEVVCPNGCDKPHAHVPANPVAVQAGGTRARIIDVLANGAALTTGEVVSMSGLPYGRCSMMLTMMARDGTLTYTLLSGQKRGGRYALARPA